MAWDVLHGPPGVEGIHHWVLGNNALYLNNLDGSFSQALWPRVKVDRITGLHSRGDVDDNREANTARIGERALPGLPRGKTVVYTGRAQAKNPDDLRTLVTIMRAVFTEDAADEGAMICNPHPTIGGTALLYAARCTQFDVDDEQTFAPTAQPSPFQRGFTLGLRQSDPRYYAAGALSETAPAADGATVTVTNAGLARTDPIISGAYDGSGTITLENLDVAVPGGHATLQFASGLPAGVFTVNFYANPRTAVLNPTAPGDDIDAMGYLTAQTWWDANVPGLAPTTTSGGPGDNDIKVTGLSNWTVSWRDASW